MERMKRLTEEDETAEMTQEELLKQFEKVESQTAECKCNENDIIWYYKSLSTLNIQVISKS